MGWRNVAACRQVLGTTPPDKLGARARSVILTMAELTRDEDDPPRYWGGWARLAEVLGYDPSTYDTNLVAKRAVARCLADLVNVDLVDREQAGRQGWQAVYTLRFGGPRWWADGWN